MTPETAEALAHRYHTSVADVVVGTGMLDRHPAVLGAILAADSVVYLNGQAIRGMAGAEQLATIQRVAIPDAHMTHHETIVAGDQVAIRWTLTGTHGGPYGDIPATGKPIQIAGIDLFQLRDGMIATVWIAFDNLGVLQQMGALPTPGQVQEVRA